MLTNYRVIYVIFYVRLLQMDEIMLGTSTIVTDSYNGEGGCLFARKFGNVHSNCVYRIINELTLIHILFEKNRNL